MTEARQKFGKWTKISLELPAGAYWSSTKKLPVYCGCNIHRDADKHLARPTCRCILFDGENISFDASLAIYI